LTDLYPKAAKSIWNLEGIYAHSRHIPQVRFPGIVHPGLIGTLPSKQLLDSWNKREKELFDSDPNRVPPLAMLPYEKGSVLGLLEGTDKWK